MMDNLRRITGSFSLQSANIGSTGRVKSPAGGDSINIADSFQPSQDTSPGIIGGIAAVGDRTAAVGTGKVLFDISTLLQPAGDGKFTATTKIPCGDSDYINHDLLITSLSTSIKPCFY